MGKQLSGLLNNCFGDSQSFKLEHRIFNAVMIITSLTGLVTAIYDVILDNHIAQTIISLLCAVVPGICYFYSLKSGKYKHLISLANIYFFIALTVGWFVTNGVHGSLPFFFFILVTYGNIFIKNPFKVYFPIIVSSIIIMLVLEYYYPFLFIKYDNRKQEYFDIGISLLLCLVINGTIIHLVFREYLRERALKDEILKQTIRDKELIDNAFNEIRVLRGLIPICAHCKKIRESEGSWKQIEEYISMHSDAQFSHGICPDCVKVLYPTLACRNIK